MRKGIEERCVQVGRYLFENSSTVRATAKEVQEVLATNKRERSTRGGNATRKKYLSFKSKR